MDKALFDEVIHFLKTRPGANASFLMNCLLGKGERSFHFLLQAYLAQKPQYLVIGEFPIGEGRETVDLLVTCEESKLPIAVIELKHYSVHQGDIRNALLTGAFSLDSDLGKRTAQKLRWGENVYRIGTEKTVRLAHGERHLPLIQIGLLTAVHRADHAVQFTQVYLKGQNGALGAPAGNKSALLKFGGAKAAFDAWRNARSLQYRQGEFIQGEMESFMLPSSTGQHTFEGYVSCLCLKT